MRGSLAGCDKGPRPWQLALIAGGGDASSQTSSGLTTGSWGECPVEKDGESFRRDSCGEDPFGEDPFGDDPFGDDPFGDDPFGDDPFGVDPWEQARWSQRPQRGDLWWTCEGDVCEGDLCEGDLWEGDLWEGDLWEGDLWMKGPWEQDEWGEGYESTDVAEAWNWNVETGMSGERVPVPRSTPAAAPTVIGFLKKDGKMLTVFSPGLQQGLCLDCDSSARPGAVKTVLADVWREKAATPSDDVLEFQRLVGRSYAPFPARVASAVEVRGSIARRLRRRVDYHLTLLQQKNSAAGEALPGEALPGEALPGEALPGEALELDHRVGSNCLDGLDGRCCHEEPICRKYQTLGALVQHHKMSLRLFMSIMLESIQKLKSFSKRALLRQMHPKALPLAYDGLKQKVDSGYIYPYLASMDQILFAKGDPLVSVFLQPRFHTKRSAAMDMTGLLFAKVAILCGAIKCPQVRDSQRCSGRQPACKAEEKVVKTLLKGRAFKNYDIWHTALSACYKEAEHQKYTEQYIISDIRQGCATPTLTEHRHQAPCRTDTCPQVLAGPK
ncbi:hypothetical protein GNI_043860 [Gregarina niphandrodes]|uniref:Uncharacterized protein n=1 Tax=Gregarina niphandrodes TaxID=110365 RepID=A0A023B9X1_GRENI|nr:hypothetical protein GNI_043860 [Gregarina niphandrodes]EZG76986.1 hypothetical protein GNI_043860 [Gregarina niphandrodes]|eukprot:XP_011129554.1 hypothetical protein GNI_043860 [Gregarina niphandrodes]